MTHQVKAAKIAALQAVKVTHQGYPNNPIKTMVIAKIDNLIAKYTAVTPVG